MQARASSYVAAPYSTNSCFDTTIGFLVTQDQVEVCPLSRGVMLPYGWRNPYPSHYGTAFAFSTILYPQPHRLALRLAFPEGGLWVYHVSFAYSRGLGLASLPVVQRLRLVR